MNSKIMVRVLIIFFFLSIPSYAKQKELQSQKPLTADDIVAKMKIQLELNDQQVDEVKPIIENYLAQEKQLKLEEKKELGKVLTGGQMFTWNFLQNEPSRDKKHAKL